MINKFLRFMWLLIKEDRYMTLIVIIVSLTWLTYKIWSYVGPFTELVGVMFSEQQDLRVDYAKMKEEMETMKDSLARQKAGRELGKEFELVIRK